MHKKVIGDPVVIGGRTLSLSRAIRAGDFIFLTGQVPFKNGEVMTDGTIEEQTEVVIEDIKKTLQTANCQLTDIVKAMVWLSKKEYFPGFNEVFSKYFRIMIREGDNVHFIHHVVLRCHQHFTLKTTWI